jgi:hypothetical protein
VVLENEFTQVMIIPRLGGRVWRWFDKKRSRDLLWRGRVPISRLKRGLDAASYVNLGGYEEYTGAKFGSPGWTEPYESANAVGGTAVTLTAKLPRGLKLTRSISLVADRAGFQVESILENVSTATVAGVMLRAHPQFCLPPGGNPPVLQVRQADGRYAAVTHAQGENLFGSERLPHGAWFADLPCAGARIGNDFVRDQVGTCLFYLGPEFFNLELFSPLKDLAPGEKLRLTHRYILTAAE